MSHSVDRLKELLFDSEARTLSDVQQRLSQRETDHATEVRERQLIADRLEAVFQRAGTEDRFSASVATVLDVALCRAEIERHAELSEAVAPLVVRTIRAEIVNSRDEMVEALYPITGRLVKAYVASAISDLAAQINRRVESNPVMLRLRSLTSGRSVAELALADNGAAEVEELYLIRRGTGELLGVWPQPGSANRDHAMSGVLAAINEFASDAFGDNGTALRHVDMGTSRVYLRASPLYLLAARCSGVAPASAEQMMDDAFLSTIEGVHTAAQSSDQPAVYRPHLMDLSERLSSSFAEVAANQRSSQLSPVLVLFGLIAAATIAGVAWMGLDRYYADRAHTAAATAIAETPGTKGYLIDIDVSSFGRRVTLTGLLQDQNVKAALIQRLRQSLPGTNIDDHLTPLPGALGEIGPAIEEAAVTASLNNATARLQQALSDLPAIAALDDNTARKQTLAQITKFVSDSIERLQSSGRALLRSQQAQHELSLALRQHASDLAAIVAGRQPQRGAAENVPAPRSTTDSARQLELAADQLATVTAALLQGNAARSVVPKPAPPVIRAADITAFERLAVWVRSHAVFFGDDLAFRDEARANATLDELARLMRETEAMLRVVGYTDAKGTTDRNSTLSSERSNKVVQALVARGVPASRLVSVGRQFANQISMDTGERSTNRRVEFELGFDGEGAP